MKELKLSFIAQRLDNQDPDHMELEGCRLREEDGDERQKLDRQISEVSWDGSQVFSEEHHAAFLLDDKFLLKTPPKERDEAGRISPILCYGRVPPEPSKSWPGDVVKELIAFAGRIERTVQEKSAKVAQRAVEAVVKKSGATASAAKHCGAQLSPSVWRSFGFFTGSFSKNTDKWRKDHE